MNTSIELTKTPIATRAVVEAAVRRAVRRQDAERVIALRATPEWRDDAVISVDAVAVEVRPCSTVLGVLEAISDHAGPGYLVVLTPCEDLGNSVLARVAGHELRPVNRFDLVREAFGAKVVDSRLSIRQWTWLSEALIDAQPPGGWPKLSGGVLTLDTALRTLAKARFGRDVDVSALLEWSRDDAAVARWTGLPQHEREGLADWLVGMVGSIASMVLRLTDAGHAQDAVPLGLAMAVIYDPSANGRPVAVRAQGRIEERYFSSMRLRAVDVRRFAEAAESAWTRWGQDDRANGKAEAALARAEQILVELSAESLAALSPVLTSGFTARLEVLAEAFGTEPARADVVRVEDVLDQLRQHRVRREDELEPAEMAVRLTRWLHRASDASLTATVGGFAVLQIREWAWVDRALSVLWQADTARVPQLRSVYSALYAAVRRRRADLDKLFAERLAAWSPTAIDSEEVLLAETLLEHVARPVAAKALPIVVVIDGMSAAVACRLAEGILTHRQWNWVEAGRHADGREPAIAVIPSITQFSRTSLLSGQLTAGKAAREQTGFRAFWKSRKTALFHKAALPGGAGAKLDEDLLNAIRDRSVVVGVVLNAVDESLDKGKQDGRAEWTFNGIAYLQEVLAAAWAAGRPVILTSDHGHVLDRGTPRPKERAPSARHRSGTADIGEVLVRGHRVLAENNEVVVPWDESIRYTIRHAGYHGGVSLAEMVIPVLVFLPSAKMCPPGWQVYEPSLHAPSWWSERVQAAPTEPAPRKQGARKTRRSTKPLQENALLTVEEAAPAPRSLGSRVVESNVFDGQRSFVRNAPAPDAVAALIDGIHDAGGKLPISAAADLVAQPLFRMTGYLATVARLLNVDGYLVLSIVDDGRTVSLDRPLLRQQFLGES